MRRRGRAAEEAGKFTFVTASGAYGPTLGNAVAHFSRVAIYRFSELKLEASNCAKCTKELCFREKYLLKMTRQIYLTKFVKYGIMEVRALRPVQGALNPLRERSFWPAF